MTEITSNLIYWFVPNWYINKMRVESHMIDVGVIIIQAVEGVSRQFQQVLLHVAWFKDSHMARVMAIAHCIRHQLYQYIMYVPNETITMYISIYQQQIKWNTNVRYI